MHYKGNGHKPGGRVRGRAKGKWSIREDIEGAGGPEGSMADGCTGRGKTDGREGRRGEGREGT